MLQVEYYGFSLKYFPTGRKNRLIEPTTLSTYKNGIELIYGINFTCLLLKADFRIFYFELEALLNKLVKLRSYFFQKNNFEQKCRVFYFHQKGQPIF